MARKAARKPKKAAARKPRKVVAKKAVAPAIAGAPVSTLPPHVLAMLEELLERLRNRCWLQYHVVEVRDNAVNPKNLTGVSEGDWVCWVNHDKTAHDVTFDLGKWPFLGAQKTIALPGCSPSAWQKVKTGSKGKRYSYDIANKPGPPNGPDMLVG